MTGLVHEHYDYVCKSTLQVGPIRGSQKTLNKPAVHSTLNFLLTVLNILNIIHFCLFQRFYFNMNVFRPAVRH